MTSVLFIGGAGRSGSTLLTRAIGSLPGYVAVGETFYVWDQGVAKDRVCSCWQPFSRCPFWSSVGEAAFGGWSAVDAVAARQLRRRLLRTRRVPALAAPRRPPSVESDLRDYAHLMQRLYQGISAVADGAVIVDSSKYPAAAYLLRHLEGVDSRLLHLVRDSRGVAYSWSKSFQRIEDGRAFPRIGTTRISAEWLADNALFAGLEVIGMRRLVVRYDDFVAHPASVLIDVSTFAGRPVDGDQLDFLAPGQIRLDPVHIAAGNPMRFETGHRPMRLDDQWRRAMPATQRRAVAALTSPGLVAYGYLGRRRVGSAASRPSP